MVAFTNRWVPEAKYTKRLMEENFCGETFHYNICQLAAYGRPGGNWMWRSVPELSGGASSTTSASTTWTSASGSAAHQGRLRNAQDHLPRASQRRRPAPTAGDDTDAFIAEFQSGAQGIFHISWTSVGDRIMRHEIAGRDGFLSLSLYTTSGSTPSAAASPASRT